MTIAPTYTDRATTLGTEASLAQATTMMEALVAAYAYMAHADGEAAGAERRRIFSILRQNAAMAVFSRHELTEEIAAHEANYRYDPEVAQHIALEKMAAIVDRPSDVRRLVLACREIIPADGVLHPAEYRALKEIKVHLNYESVASGRVNA